MVLNQRRYKPSNQQFFLYPLNQTGSFHLFWMKEDQKSLFQNFLEQRKNKSFFSKIFKIKKTFTSKEKTNPFISNIFKIREDPKKCIPTFLK